LQRYSANYKIGLFVKNKKEISLSKKGNDIHKEIFDKIVENWLLFDTSDIITALDVFCLKFSENIFAVDDFIENVINPDYLLSVRERLVLKLHQKMTKLHFENTILKNKHRMWCIAHKPRSGKINASFKYFTP
jgi:hypothetical protein